MNHKLFSCSVFIGLFLLLSGCSEKKQADFSNYITGYTSGIIKSSSSVQVCLNNKPDKGFLPGSTLPPEILKITPAIKGELVLKENNCVEFVPAERFQNGVSYTANLNLGALSDVPSDYKTFRFEFKIIPLLTRLDAGDLLAGQTDSLLTYQAVLYSSDYIDPEILEKQVTASLDGNGLALEWTHADNKHNLVIPHIRKKTNAQTLTLTIKQNNKTEQTDVDIPKLEELQVLNVKASDARPAVISIFMSEKLDPSQDLNGLISVNENSRINYKIQNNVIYVYMPSNESAESLDVRIQRGIKSANGNLLSEDYFRTVKVATAKPAVELIGKGVIVPDEQSVLIPFSSIALKAVDS